MVTYSFATQTNVTSNKVTFVYDKPRIDRLYPETPLVSRGGIIALTGSSFGSEVSSGWPQAFVLRLASLAHLHTYVGGAG